MTTVRTTRQGAEIARGMTSYRFEMSILNISVSFRLFAIVQQAPHAQDTRATQETQEDSATAALGLSNMASAAQIDPITEDMTENALSHEAQVLQRAARAAYLGRLADVSNRNSLRCLEAAAKAELDRIARLDVESLRKLERATTRLETHLVTPPKKEQWRYNNHSSPEETTVSSSSSSRRIHSIPSQSSPEYGKAATDLRMNQTAIEGQSRSRSGIAALSSKTDVARAAGTVASWRPKSKLASDDQQRFVKTNISISQPRDRAANMDRVQKWLDESIHGSAEGLDFTAELESESVQDDKRLEENLNQTGTNMLENQGSEGMSEEATPAWQDTAADDSTVHRDHDATTRAARSPALAAESVQSEDDWTDVGLEIDD